MLISIKDKGILMLESCTIGLEFVLSPNSCPRSNRKNLINKTLFYLKRKNEEKIFFRSGVKRPDF